MSALNQVALIEKFYQAFAALDSDAMQSCYSPGARFQDPVFTLDGREQVGGMWRMLCDTVRRKGLDAWRLEVSDIASDGTKARAHWQPHYRFSATGRLVHNIVDARFSFDEGLIVSHHDRFDFWRWSRQALGPTGTLLGWSPMLRGKVRAQAARNLEQFVRQRE